MGSSDGAAVEAADLAAWCAQRLTAAKVPRYLEFVDALPYTPTGRLAKSLLPGSAHPPSTTTSPPPSPAPRTATRTAAAPPPAARR